LTGKAALPQPASWQAALNYALAYGKAIWQALVLGLLLGSAVQTLLPSDWIARVLGAAGMRSVAAGALLAVPGMMCTCCAAPVVVGLRQQQATRGAAVAFWLGNTVLNPATLVFMGFVLGWHWTALRLVLGAVLVLGSGWWLDRQASPAQRDAARAQLDATTPAAVGRIISASPAALPFATGSHAAASRSDTVDRPVFIQWLRRIAKMTALLVPEYIALVLLLGAARAFLFPHVGPEVDNSLGWILAFAIAGTLFVIPTAGEVPIVQTMLAFGVGVGPAAALLMTLAPISLPSLAMTARALGWHAQLRVIVMVVTVGITAGFAAVALHF